jgi:uncharacterized protein (DUF2249 family)
MRIKVPPGTGSYLEAMSALDREPEYHLLVDGRGLEPPEPMARVLDALDGLSPGQRLLFLIHLEPRPLFRVLHQNGYEYRCTPDPDGSFRVLIWHQGHPPQRS